MKTTSKILALTLAVVIALAVPVFVSASTSTPYYLVLDNVRYKITASADVLSSTQSKGEITIQKVRGSAPDAFSGYVKSIAYNSNGVQIGSSSDTYEFWYVNSFSASSTYTASNGNTVSKTKTEFKFLTYTGYYGPTV